MRRVLFCALTVAAALVAGQARALAFETAYTIDAPLAITAGGTTATINPVDPLFVDNGLDGFDTVCLAGACDILSQDWIVFSVSVTGTGSVDGLGAPLLGNPSLAALGMGYFLLGNPIQDGSGSADTYNGSLAVATTPAFNFVANGGGAGLTGTSLVLFVAYADGVMPHVTEAPFNIWGNNVVNFMVTEYGSAAVATNHANFLTTAEVVPEPSTALLVGFGILALGAGARRRRS